jgi:hypothetical protein
MVRAHDHQHPRPDLMSGLPSTVHSPSTLEGQIEQAGKIAWGLRNSRRGWRRAVFLAGASVIVLAFLIVVFSVVTRR